MPSASEIDGLARACKYSFVTNRLDYCGEHDAFREFESFIADPSEEKAEKIRSLFPSFKGLYAYLQLISECNGMDPLDEDVVEAYWLGNALLDRVPLAALKKMLLEKSSAPGLLPPKIAEEKAASISGKVLPHHSFHVLHVNFMTRKVEPVLENLGKCLVKAGKVIEVENEAILVDCPELRVNEKGFFLESVEKNVDIGFCAGVSEGESFSIHWDFAVEKISRRQAGQLEHYTNKNIELVNSIRFRRPSIP